MILPYVYYRALSDIGPKSRFAEGSSVDKKASNRIRRRDLLRVVASLGITGTALAARTGSTDAGIQVQPDRGKRKAQYQGSSLEVQTFYRVNRYPMK
jgi:hypothetical protein